MPGPWECCLSDGAQLGGYWSSQSAPTKIGAIGRSGWPDSPAAAGVVLKSYGNSDASDCHEDMASRQTQRLRTEEVSL